MNRCGFQTHPAEVRSVTGTVMFKTERERAKRFLWNTAILRLFLAWRGTADKRLIVEAGQSVYEGVEGGVCVVKVKGSG